MALFTFSTLDQKHTFGANLIQKIKMISLSSNLLPRLIRICRVQWCSLLFQCSFFLMVHFILQTPSLVNGVKRTMIIVSAALRE